MSTTCQVGGDPVKGHVDEPGPQYMRVMAGGWGGGRAGTMPCMLLISLLKPKVISRRENANLCTTLGNADSSSLFWKPANIGSLL